MTEDASVNPIPRRRLIGAVAAAAVTTTLFPATSVAQKESMNPFADLFTTSQNEKKGLTFYVGGQPIAGIVTKVNSDAVEVRNQTHSRVVIRLDRVDAVALS